MTGEWRTGRKVMTLEPPLLVQFDAFWVRGSDPEECWVWTGARSNGYGVYRGRYAHRLAWTLVNGPIPETTPEIRHAVCNNPPCTNPRHLLPGTHADNMRDKIPAGRATGWNSTKTHCPQGHAYEGDNMRIKASGARACRQCARDRAERIRRALGKPIKRQQFCPQGHEYTPSNTRVKPNGRACRTCEQEYDMRYRARKKAEIG